MGTERKRKTSVSAKLGRAATTNGTAAAAAAANQPLIGEVPRVPRHSRSAARSPCGSRRTISSPSSTTTRPSSSSEKPEAASTQYLNPQIHRSAAIGSGERHSGFQYGVDKVFQPLPSSPSMGHELLCWISVRSGESVFRPLPSLPSTGQSAFPSATTLHLYTHITLKPSYAMYYVDLVMKPSNVLS
uniref:Uncharacterized protein n=1 Tax=Oryza meridionalis TaxID=40149 RepID=A0A0E0CJS7_9ORYZ